MTVKDYINSYIDRLPEGSEFSPREICSYVYRATAGIRNPMDSSVTREIRYRRAEKGDVALKSRAKSLYIKVAKQPNP